MNVRRLMIAACLVAAGNAGAETLFINDATVHPMGIRPMMQDADILVRDGRVQALGVGLDAPSDATVIEANGRPVTPGLFAGITAHGLVEISLVEESSDDKFVEDKVGGERMRPEFDVTRAYNPASTAIPVTRSEGLTWSLLGASMGDSIIGGQGRAVSFDGGYGSFVGDSMLFINIGGGAAAKSGGSRAAQWMLLEQAVAEARSELEWQPAPLLTPLGRTSLAGYLEGGKVVFTANRASDILQVLAFAAEHGVEAVIRGGAEAWKVADQLASAGVPVVLNPLVNLPSNFDQIGARLDNAVLLHAAGVTVAFSGQATHNARKQRQAAGNAVANGLPWDTALAAITSNPASIFGLEDGHGTIEPGGPADLVIWSGDPLEVTTWADTVIIGGKRIPATSRQTLLRDRYLPEQPTRPRAYIREK